MKFLFALLLFAPAVVAAAQKPNVIYLLADDLGLGDLSCYGQEKFKTPSIDRIAKEGIQFTAHYSGNTVCSPSRAVLMTGQQPGKVYLRGNVTEEITAPLDPQMTVLPEIFKAAGYATGAFGKWGLGHTHLEGKNNPLTHGFDEFCGWKSQMIAHTYYPSSYVHNGKEIPLKKETYVHDIIMNNALQFMERNAKEGRPFFCYIPTAIPHAAMHAPPELHQKWRKRLPQFDHIIGKYRIHRGDGSDSVPDVVNPIAGFAAMLEHLDNQVSDILALLDYYDIDDQTLIIFSSDNGAHREGGHRPEFWNSTASLRGMKRDMHEGGIRTPMLARWPGVISPGTTTNHLSAFQDVLPTMAELVEQPLPKQADGISFLPLLKGMTHQQKKHEFLYWEFCKGNEQSLFSQAIRMKDWKGYREKSKNQGAMTPLELYNLKEDPFEQTNLALQEPQIVTQLLSLIKKARQPLPGQVQ
jgi:arylsulfatase A-like enzyme